jgi:hypothetical protein
VASVLKSPQTREGISCEGLFADFPTATGLKPLVLRLAVRIWIGRVIHRNCIRFWWKLFCGVRGLSPKYPINGALRWPPPHRS